MPVSSNDFRRALGHFASGVTVVTTASKDRQGGLTVSAFSSVSLNPPYVLVCIDKHSSNIELIRESGHFAVNYLNSEQTDVSNHFASRNEDKFSGVSHRTGKFGCPLLDDALGHIECSVTQEIDAGDHLIFLGEVQDAAVDDSKQPLVYYHGGYRRLTE